MRTQFYNPTAKPSMRTQGVTKTYKRIQLSKEARMAINARKQEASRHYKKDLDEAWAEIDKVTENLAITHHKSVRRIQQELHMGGIRAKSSKTNAWNAFSWKKNRDLKEENERNKRAEGDESEQHICLIEFSIFLMLFLDSTVGPDSKITGKKVLQELVRTYWSEYDALTTEQKEQLVREFDEYKASKTLGFRVLTRSRVNDVTHTLKSVENEVCARILPLFF
jgi:hypothetical protein